jgi:hypothetical protein
MFHRHSYQAIKVLMRMKAPADHSPFILNLHLKVFHWLLIVHHMIDQFMLYHRQDEQSMLIM